MIEAVVFDLDGTLINLLIDYERLFRRFRGILNKDDIRPLTKTVAGLDEKTRKKIFEVWDQAELTSAEKITMNDEGMLLYKKYSAKPKALVTMQGKAFVQTTLESLGLSFRLVVTREDSLDRVEQLRNVARKLGTRVQDILFVGNTEGDLVAAAKIGCKFLRVEHGKSMELGSKNRSKLLNNTGSR